MDVAEPVPGLYFLRFPVGHAYLRADPGGLTLIDTGLPGCASQIGAAIGQAGHDPAEVRQIVHAEPVTRNAAALLRTAARYPGHHPAHEEGSGG